ncbi:ferredoxin--NADP reductase [Tepidibacter aestuarii]|uniref:ferredoxin--NADP reductase n=1 Tax=Tepidibacter aestuarii TaxID=2925782 RepID=UPI0020C108C6|nr:FAD-dependent oxidoreductase [Tepidibacter aestuarii]CAH2213432.1 conserved protein of unknown function [Tepidibacter aestuarii]
MSSAVTKRYSIKLINIIKHNNETFSFDFKSSKLKEWSEGDSSKIFISIKGQEVGKKFSYTTLPYESHIRFTTRIRMNRSEYKDQLSKLKIGDTIEITEPQGNFKLLREKRPIVLLSNGVGIAAVRSLIKAYQRNKSNIPIVVQINVDSTGAIYKSEFDELMNKTSHFSSYYTSHRGEFYKRLDHEIQKIVSAYEEDPYLYVVGSDNFVSDIIRHLKDVGFLDCDIITDAHVSSGGSCGCSISGGCGCGANLI